MQHRARKLTPDEVRELVAALPTMNLYELRNLWTKYYGCPPRLKSVNFLRLLLAWRFQEDVFGGLAPETIRALKRSAPSQRAELCPGLKLSREWKGVRHEVEVADGGVCYGGEVYASLSEVARTITGVRWNGPRFFGLRGGS